MHLHEQIVRVLVVAAAAARVADARAAPRTEGGDAKPYDDGGEEKKGVLLLLVFDLGASVRCGCCCCAPTRCR